MLHSEHTALMVFCARLFFSDGMTFRSDQLEY